MMLKEGETESPVEFPEEKKGWHGYIEWEKYPEKKAKMAELLKKYDFPDVSNIPRYFG